MTSEQVTTIIVGVMLLLSHFINYRATINVKRKVAALQEQMSVGQS